MVQEDVIVITSRNETVDAEIVPQGILSQLFGTAAGRRQLAASMAAFAGKRQLKSNMAAPIRRNLDYQRIARKIFNVDPLPQGALPTYDKDVTEYCIDESDVYYTSDNRMVDPNNFYLPKVKVPKFELYDCPKIGLGDIKRRRFSIIDRAVQRARQEIMAAQDQSIFDILGDISNPLDIKSGNKSL